MRRVDLIAKTVVTFPVIVFFSLLGLLFILLKALFTLRKPIWDIEADMWHFWWKEVVNSKFS